MPFLAAALLAGVPSAQSSPLDALRWQKRLLLVFVQDDPAAADRQIAALDAAGTTERDLLVVEVPRAGSVTVPGVGAVEGADLRRAYGIGQDASFMVLLVGKDGGVKQRADAPIEARALFETIDAMPMRRNEMRQP